MIENAVKCKKEHTTRFLEGYFGRSGDGPLPLQACPTERRYLASKGPKCKCESNVNVNVMYTLHILIYIILKFK